jgi:excisionase family DNA binding protein
MHTADSRSHDGVVAEQRLLTIPEAARYLGCTVWSVRDLIWKGDLPYTRFGKRFQVDIRDLDALIEREKRREGADLDRPVRV